MESERVFSIMIIEENDMLRSRISNALSALPQIQMAVLAKHFRQLRETLERQRPDVILMDVGLAMSNRDELKRLRAGAGDVSILMYAEEATEEFRECAFEMGAEDVASSMGIVDAMRVLLKRRARQRTKNAI